MMLIDMHGVTHANKLLKKLVTNRFSGKNASWFCCRKTAAFFCVDCKSREIMLYNIFEQGSMSTSVDSGAVRSCLLTLDFVGQE